MNDTAVKIITEEIENLKEGILKNKQEFRKIRQKDDDAYIKKVMRRIYRDMVHTKVEKIRMLARIQNTIIRSEEDEEC